VLAVGIHNVLVKTFGVLYWVGYYTVYILRSLVTYVPMQLWGIIQSIGGGIGKACKEVWVWVFPKSMV